LTCATPGFADRPARGFGGGVGILDGRAGAPADALSYVTTSLTDVFHGFAGPPTDLFDRRPQPSRHVLQKLWVPIDRRQHPSDDRGDIVETNLEQRLRLHARSRSCRHPVVDCR
jgi:hypothetical protein